jgi:hypothetical protein
MQKPKYDKYKPLPDDIISRSCSSKYFSGYVTARICIHVIGKGVFYMYDVARANNTPAQIYKDAEIDTLYDDVTFASVNLCNVTVQVI